METINQKPVKASGMPLGAKFFLALLIMIGVSYYVYQEVIIKLPTVPAAVVVPPPNFLFTDGKIIPAKCRDFKDISLYLECGITKEEYNGVLVAVASFPSTQLTIKNQELTFVVNGVKLRVYNCQMAQGVLMGKLTKQI